MVGIRSPPAASRSTCLGLLVADPSSQPPFETPISSAVRDSGTLKKVMQHLCIFWHILNGESNDEEGQSLSKSAVHVERNVAMLS